MFRLLLNANAVHLDAARHRGALPDRQLSKLSTQGRMSGIIDAMSAVIPGLSQKRAIAQVAAEYQAAWAQFQTSTGVLDRLDLVAPDTLVDARLRHELRQHYEQARGQAHRQLDDTAEQFPEFVAAMQARHAARMGLLAESEVYSSRADHGTLSASAAEGLLHATEVALDRLRGLEADKLRTEPKELLKKVPFFAEVISDLLAALINAGVTFIPFDEAAADPAYNRAATGVTDKFLIYQQKLALLDGAPVARVAPECVAIHDRVAEMARS